jgi:hypothetical protein
MIGWCFLLFFYLTISDTILSLDGCVLLAYLPEWAFLTWEQARRRTCGDVVGLAVVVGVRVGVVSRREATRREGWRGVVPTGLWGEGAFFAGLKPRATDITSLRDGEASERRGTQAEAVGARVAEVRTAEVGTVGARVAEVQAAEVGTVGAGVAEVQAAEAGTVGAGVAEVRAAEAGTVGAGVAEVRAAEAEAVGAGVAEVRAAEAVESWRDATGGGEWRV